jgi:hypothetical protein
MYSPFLDVARKAISESSKPQKKKRGFTAPDGTFYEWTKPTPPTQADIDAVVQYHQEAGQFYAGAKKGMDMVSNVTRSINVKPTQNETHHIQPGKNKKKGINFGDPNAKPAVSGEAAIFQMISEGRAPDVEAIKRYHDMEAQGIAQAVAPIVGPIGAAVGFATGIPGAQKVGQEIAPQLAGGIIGMPSNAAGDLAILTNPQANAVERAGAAANIASLFIPVEELAVGGIVKAVSKLKAKGANQAAKAIEDALKSGVNPQEVDRLIRPKQKAIIERKPIDIDSEITRLREEAAAKRKAKQPAEAPPPKQEIPEPPKVAANEKPGYWEKGGE